MLVHLPIALAALVATVAWGTGGYEPWAMLILEVSAVLLTGWVVVSVLFATSRDERERNVAIARATKRSLFRRRTSDVEITPPSDSIDAGELPSTPTPRGFDRFYLFGYSFRRTGVGALALGLTAWIVLSLVPLDASWLSFLSPKAHSLRSEVATLVGGDSIASAPWSVAPFLSFQDLLLWLAYAMVFWVTFQAAGSSRAVRRLTIAIVLIGVASGVYGLAQWLTLVGSSLTDTGARATGFMATGTFGNRNHYAFFQEMALLTGLGWLAWYWAETDKRARDRVVRQEAKARAGLLALGVGAVGASLVFSLSRSGITFTVCGIAALMWMSRGRHGERRSSGRTLAAALALCFVAAILWIGIDPVLTRFELVPDEFGHAGEGRAAVWRDSMGAVGDFWLTGSGLSSFQYVFPIYRSFGGRRFYSWAHNDYLQIAIELGLPGLLLTGAVLVWIVRRARRVRAHLTSEARSAGWSYLHAGYCAAAVAVALHSFTDFGLHLPGNAVLFAVIVGVITGYPPYPTSRRHKKIRKKKLRRSPPVPA